MLGIFQNIGPWELIIVLIILILLFGATKIPQLARSLGKSVSEFKKGVREDAEATKPEQEQKSDEEKKS